MAITIITIGETVAIPRRIIAEHMHDRRDELGLAPRNALNVGSEAKILRVYTRPRGQDVVRIDVEETEVRVTAMARGYAVVDVIDEISEPAGTDYEIYVVRTLA